MIHARIISGAEPADLDLAFARMALPRAARDYLLEKIPFLHVLMTGLERPHARFLRGCAEGGEAPGYEPYPSFVAGEQKKRPGSALLSGRKDQFDRLLTEARRASVEDEGLTDLAAALDAALRTQQVPAPVTLGSERWAFGDSLRVMGVVNVTPDSFSDGGRYFDPAEAVAQGLALARAGADILDVGGESTRPGSGGVSAEEECRRVVPVIEGLRQQTSVPISIDTRKAAVAREAIRAGAVLVNDVSGFRDDPALPAVIAESGVACCAMHIQGTPADMQKNPSYEDAVAEILGFLGDSVARAQAAGVRREQILVDPGIGFGKTFAHNHLLLRRVRDFRALGLPVLVGPSRKAFLGALVGGKPAAERGLATAACVAAVVMTRGADVVRVHDVSEVRDALTVATAIRDAGDGGTLY